jgi:hypothetical protein
VIALRNPLTRSAAQSRSGATRKQTTGEASCHVRGTWQRTAPRVVRLPTQRFSESDPPSTACKAGAQGKLPSGQGRAERPKVPAMRSIVGKAAEDAFAPWRRCSSVMMRKHHPLLAPSQNAKSTPSRCANVVEYGSKRSLPGPAIAQRLALTSVGTPKSQPSRQSPKTCRSSSTAARQS